MSLVNANPLILAPDGGYNISRSVRLRSSASGNFSRTPSASGNMKTWTWSAWVKRGLLSQTGTLWGSNFSSGGFGMAFGNYSGAGVSPEVIGVTLYAVGTVTTIPVFRDPSAWYHIVARFDSTQATQANRFRLYINGVQQTLSSALNVTLNADYHVNAAGRVHTLGGESGYSNDCYLADINHIDGQSLDPSSFGETSPVTGVWQPKKYAGTYGTNGFFLNFSDNSSNTATTIGKDYSGNSNNWTPNNISVTSGSTYDSMLDVPTLWADGGNGRGNYCTLNPLPRANIGLSRGNLTLTTAGGAGSNQWCLSPATMFLSSGKWYAEFYVDSKTGDAGGSSVQLGAQSDLAASTFTYGGYLGNQTNGEYSYQAHGYTYFNNVQSGSAVWASYTTGDTIGIALDLDAYSIAFYKNNTLQGSTSLLTGRAYAFAASIYQASICSANFGQRPFAYTPPTGFKALNTQNLPEPVIKKGNQYMDVSLYTGNAGSITVTNAGFQPDLVWIKARSSAYDHKLVDAVRGASGGIYYDLSSNSSGAESLPGAGVNGLTSTGFTIGGGTNNGYNGNGTTFAAWQWKEGATPGFDIVAYTGDGTSPRNISHSLGAVPAMVIVKSRGSVSSWIVKQKNLSSNNVLFLEATNAQLSPSNGYVQDLNNSSTFGVVSGGGGVANVNTNGTAYVAYLFAEVAGFSKFGSYTGNGSTDGPFVFTGFRPRFVLVKNYSAVNNWWVWDTARNTYNAMNEALVPNLSVAEQTPLPIDCLANGFKFRTSNGEMNNNGNNYIYMAFAENPFRYALAR